MLRGVCFSGHETQSSNRVGEYLLSYSFLRLDTVLASNMPALKGVQTGTVPRGSNNGEIFSSSTKTQDNTVALHDAKKIAKCEAHLIFPSLGGGHITRHGSALELVCFAQLGLCRV